MSHAWSKIDQGCEQQAARKNGISDLRLDHACFLDSRQTAD